MQAGPRSEEVGFAHDSALEGDGFEPSVPAAREPVYIAEGELRGDRRAAKKIWRGTDGSNPSPSSGESRANLTSSAQILEKARAQWRAWSRGPVPERAVNCAVAV